MKAKFLIPMFLILLGSIIVSCNSEEGIQSNGFENELTKKKTVEDIAAFRVDNLSLESLQEYEFSSQQEVFRKMTPDQRYQIWKERLSDVKKRLNNRELEHLSKIESLLNVNFFRTTMSKETSKFFFDWMAQAKRELQWSEFETLTLFCTFNPVFVTAERGAKFVPSEPDDSGKTCICSWDIYCDVFTQGVDPVCKDYGCNKTTPGCGWLFLGTCGGRCHAES